MLIALPDESVLKRPVGGAAVTAEQMGFLLEAIERRWVQVRIVRFAGATDRTPPSSMTLLRLPPADVPAVVAVLRVRYVGLWWIIVAGGWERCTAPGGAAMVEVGGDGTVGIDGATPNGGVFPLTFGVREGGGSWMVYATAAEAGEVVDLLVRSAGETVVVLGLETTSFLDADYSLWSPSRIAAERKVECAVHRLGPWAAGTPGLGEELLVMRRDDLPRLLDGAWSPNQLSIVDVPARPTSAQLDDMALAVGTAEHGTPILPRLASSRLWYSGHDDCYAAIESTDASMPARVLGRLLALSAGSSSAGDAARSPKAIAEPDAAAMRDLLRESAYWIGVPADPDHTDDGTAVIHLSVLPRAWRLGHKPPEKVDRTATLDLRRGTWELTAQT